MMAFNYWRDMWQPMTREHYAAGGYYEEHQLTIDPLTGKQAYKTLRRLSLLDALNWREPAGSLKCIHIVYKRVA